MDVVETLHESSSGSGSSVAIAMEVSEQVQEEPSIRMDQIKKQSKKDRDRGLKPTHIPILTNEILKDVLSRPEETEEPYRQREKCKHPKIGRTAYKLDVYKKKTDARIEDLRNRMNQARVAGNPEWFKLRK